LECFITLGIPDKFLLFHQKIRDGFGNLGEVKNESAIVASQVEKAADLMHSSWRLPIQYFLNLARIHGYSFWRYHMTQELNFAQPELALAEIRIKLMITQLQKHTAEMLFMLFLTLRKDQDVINEDHNKLIHLFHENWVHKVHEVSGGRWSGQKTSPDTRPTFRGGEKPMTRISTGYPDRENKDQDRWNGGNLRATSSLSFSKQTMKTYIWCPAHKVERESSSDGGNFEARMSFRAWPAMSCAQSARRRQVDAWESAPAARMCQDIAEQEKVVSIVPRE
jgi:hypothetical protein